MNKARKDMNKARKIIREELLKEEEIDKDHFYDVVDEIWDLGKKNSKQYVALAKKHAKQNNLDEKEFMSKLSEFFAEEEDIWLSTPEYMLNGLL
jgi:hypothetical protein